MFTPKQIDEIFAELDQDQSNAVDFYEVLVVSIHQASRLECVF